MDIDPGRKRLVVFAGSVVAPGGEYADQGVVVAQLIELDEASNTIVVGGADTYITPVEAGSVHITGAQGTRLILQSSNGTTFYFDLPSRQYVASLSAVSAR
jgi:hypothetical protein